MKRHFSSSIRIFFWTSTVVLTTLVKVPDMAAPWLAVGFGIDEEKAKVAVVLLVAFLSSLLAFFGPNLWKAILWFIKKVRPSTDTNFANLRWPEAPPTVNGEDIFGKTWELVKARCDERLQSTKNQLLGKELAMLPQHFVPYASIKVFLKKQATLDQKLWPPALKPGQLPPLGECWRNVEGGTAVALVGEAGSGKSYALLRQLSEHLAISPDKGRCLPIYLNLASWENLSIVEEGKRLERWVYRFIQQGYANKDRTKENTINSNEAIWLLHNLTRTRTKVKVVLCLDGLDEMQEDNQQECLDAILEYTSDGGHVVFTCRREALRTLFEPIITRELLPGCWIFELPDFTTEQECEEALIRVQLDPTLSQPTTLTELPLAVLEAARERAETVIQCLHEYKVYDYLRTPLLLNLFVKVVKDSPSFDPGTLHMLPKEEQQDHVAHLLWAEYEYIQWRDREQYEGQFWKSDFWSTMRTSLHYIAVQANSNSFRLDDIQPSTWLSQLLHQYSSPPATDGDPTSSEPIRAVARFSGILSALQWYYFTSRLLISALLATAIGCLLASPTTFLVDGILVGGLTARFTLRRNYPTTIPHPPQDRITVQRWQALREWAQRHEYTLHVIGFVASLMLACGLYEGFRVPRRPGDMQLWGTFSITQAIFGLTVGLIAGTVLGFRQTHTRDSDISLVGRPEFKWLLALRKGFLLGGLVLGGVVGVLGVILISSFPYTTLGSWLTRVLPSWRLPLPGIAPSVADGLAVFTLAFIISGTVGFLLVALLAVLERQESIAQNAEQRKTSTPPLSIAQSAWHGVGRGALVFVVLLVLLFVLTECGDGQYRSRAGRFLLMASGGWLIAFLWFGGVEFIQHYTLRVQLALLRLLPLQFGEWLFAAQEMAFVQKENGPFVGFKHDTLLKYLQLKPGTINSSQPLPKLSFPPPTYRSWILLRISLLPAMLVLLTGPLLRRFHPIWPAQAFWKHPNTLNLRASTGILVLNDSTVKVLRPGQLEITVEGLVNVGDIIGPVSPQGVAYGFLGISLDHVYDRFPTANHGALFYQVRRLSGTASWQPLPLVARPGTFIAAPRWTATLPRLIESCDYVQFAVNDSEWQNNSGSFTLHFKTVHYPSLSLKTRR